MSTIGSNSVAAQAYSGVQRSNGEANRASATISRSPSKGSEGEFKMPMNATPRGSWVLSENANPQDFEAGSPRGTYLNVVV
ncbi:MAG: hypothetical protein JWM96_1171 [Alphaproteobacteria bacterium]|nr:hypothetical protein [Alphaproteobacteria bacterium]